MRRSLWAAAILLALLILTGCKVEIDHLFEEDGSSIWQFGLGEEINPEDGESIDCTPDEEGPFPVLYANLSQRGAETWCTTGFALESPVELAYLYASFNEDGEFFRVNCLSVEDGHLVYDIEVLLDSSGVEEGDSLIWRVTAPGDIASTNADSQSGNTVTWNLTQRNGWTSLRVNADDANCPNAGVRLDLVADSPTTGTAFITAAKPGTSSEDADAIIAALSSAGWQVTDQGTEISASRTWDDAAGLQALADDLPLLEGSDLGISTNDDGETEFEAHIDLSFYEAFWQGINPAIDDPPFRFSWTPPAGDTEASGDWTDPEARRFSWTVDNTGRIFNMATRTVEAALEDALTAPSVDGEGDTETEADPAADPEDEVEAATETLVDQIVGTDADDATRAATAAAIAALLAAAGLTALSVAESGMSLTELMDTLRRGQIPEDPSAPSGSRPLFNSQEEADQALADLQRLQAAAGLPTDTEPPPGEQEEDEEERDPSTVSLELTYPAGRSPKVFTEGWLFGARCIVHEETGTRDVSEAVKWSGSGKFVPNVGRQSRPSFSTVGLNTITLSITVEGEETTKDFPISAVDPKHYARINSQTSVAADAHGCPACPHSCSGPVLTGSPTVLADGKPAARVGDTGIHAACCGPNTFEIVGGDPTVLIDGRPAARIGSSVRHCGGMGVVDGDEQTGVIEPGVYEKWTGKRLN